MKSLVVDKKGKLSVEEVPMPVYNEYKALVKMMACGICNGTDTKLIHGNFKGFEAYPAILGHEGVGRIVEKGAKVRNFEIGDVVLLPFLEGMTGQYNSGWGAFSEYAVVGDWKAMVEDGKGPGTHWFSESYYAQQIVPEFVNPVSATMMITLREVLSAAKRFGFKENCNLVIFGAGPVGLCFLRIAKLLGMGQVIVFDLIDDKVEEAIRIGADFAFNSSKADVKKEVKRHFMNGADFVVDAVGVNSLINQSMELIKHNGKICCYGISPELSMELDWSKAPYNWTLQFVQWPSKLEESESHSQIINWVQMGVIKPDDFISDVIPFHNIIKAFEIVEERKAKKKVVIEF